MKHGKLSAIHAASLFNKTNGRIRGVDGNTRKIQSKIPLRFVTVLLYFTYTPNLTNMETITPILIIIFSSEALGTSFWWG